MNARTVTDGVQWVGAVDWDRRLFDELIPLPEGTSYNAYIVRGSQKTALIDTVDPSKADILFVIDNSASMADKQSQLARRIPDLVKALANPELDSVQRVADLLVGIITSSLGSHGTSACDPAASDEHQPGRTRRQAGGEPGRFQRAQSPLSPPLLSLKLFQCSAEPA